MMILSKRLRCQISPASYCISSCRFITHFRVRIFRCSVDIPISIRRSIVCQRQYNLNIIFLSIIPASVLHPIGYSNLELIWNLITVNILMVDNFCCNIAVLNYSAHYQRHCDPAFHCRGLNTVAVTDVQGCRLVILRHIRRFIAFLQVSLVVGVGHTHLVVLQIIRNIIPILIIRPYRKCCMVFIHYYFIIFIFRNQHSARSGSIFRNNGTVGSINGPTCKHYFPAIIAHGSLALQSDLCATIIGSIVYRRILATVCIIGQMNFAHIVNFNNMFRRTSQYQRKILYLLQSEPFFVLIRILCNLLADFPVSGYGCIFILFTIVIVLNGVCCGIFLVLESDLVYTIFVDLLLCCSY